MVELIGGPETRSNHGNYRHSSTLASVAGCPVQVNGAVGAVTRTSDDGSQVDAVVVVVGVGITPSTELAETAGLTVRNGILVDEYLPNSDPDVLAAADVANAYYPSLGRRLRHPATELGHSGGIGKFAIIPGRADGARRGLLGSQKRVRHVQGFSSRRLEEMPCGPSFN
jgi:hypothetical protein